MKLKKVRQIFAFTLAFSMVTPCTAFASSAPVVEQAVVDVLEDGTQVLADGTKILPDGTVVAPETEQGTTETPSTPETETPTEPEVPDTGNQGGGTTETPDNGGTETPDNGDTEKPDNGGTETPDNGNGDNNIDKPDNGNGEETPEKPDNGNGEETPEKPDNGNGGNNTDKPDNGNGDNNTDKPDNGNGDNNTDKPDTEKPEEKPQEPTQPEQNPVETPSTPQTGQTTKPTTGGIKRPVIKPSVQVINDFRFYTVGKNYTFAKEDVSLLEDKNDTAKVIGKLSKDGMGFIIKDCKDGWFFIESGDARGFVRKEKLALNDEATAIVDSLKKKAQEQTDKENAEIKEKITKEVKAELKQNKKEKDEDFQKRIDAKIEEEYNKQKKPLINWETLVKQADTLVSAKDNKNVAYSRGTTKNTVVGKSYALVDATALNVREGKGTDQRIVGLLPNNALVYVLADTDQEWVYIESGDVRGFVHSDYLKRGAAVDAEVAKVGEDNFPKVAEYINYKNNASTYYTVNSIKGGKHSSAVREEVVAYASQFIGNPYVWGGTDPVNGADCSGFVQSIYKEFGYNLPRVSQEQAYYGTQIPVSEALPGDLIFYQDSTGDIYHVAMYAGDGMTVEAMNSENGICNGTIQSDACWAVRVLSDEDCADIAMSAEAYQLANTGEYGDYLGKFKLTYYCACPICCGEYANGITATGTVATEGRTIAVDPSVIPYGTQVIINGNVYTAEDCGGAIKDNRIDIYMNSHEACLSQGVGYADVFLKK